jgi:EAL domain-containing protein (putative c-di-GMP-specific phosphodiesterase class I)
LSKTEAAEVEWLRLKAHVVDPATGRPTLAAVLEDVRKLIDRHDTIGLVYIDVGGARLEALHGWQAYDERVRAAASTLEAARGSVLGPTDIVAPAGPRSDKFVVFLAASQGCPLAEVELEAKAAALERRLAQTDAGDSGLGPLGTPLLGMALVRRDPMLRTERAIHKALDQAMFRSLRVRSLEDERLALWLDGVIEKETVQTLFQPILDLPSRRALAREVFTHGPAGGAVEDAEALFALAERTGRALAFERLCRRRAVLGFSASRPARSTEKLFLRVSTAAANDPAFAGDGFAGELDGTGLTPDDVVIEMAERMAAIDKNAFRNALRALKEQGFGIAIDDMGAGYSSLSAIAEMEPDFLKFDMSLVRGLDKSPIKRGLLETVVEVSERVQAPVVAQGIETASELAAIRVMGVSLGQGRFLSPPAPLDMIPA